MFGWPVTPHECPLGTLAMPRSTLHSRGSLVVEPRLTRLEPGVLIRVPLVPNSSLRTKRLTRRRRLRKEFRVAGLALLLVLPTLGVALNLTGAHGFTWRMTPEARASALVDPPPLVSLSRELQPLQPPVASIVTDPPESPVVVQTPGYLLPDLPRIDDQEPYHAGR